MTTQTLYSLHWLPLGTRGKVARVNAAGNLRRRILEMGVGPGTEIIVNSVAPLGDPIEVTVKGYHLTLRKDEAKAILVEVG
ncbi:MAG: ferrous iron transport protein A [Peptococcaceae bacterium]|nr:ferrous iron transport protein A [Peptococcaceae bacterium]